MNGRAGGSLPACPFGVNPRGQIHRTFFAAYLPIAGTDGTN
jgi:hypothetical protein